MAQIIRGQRNKQIAADLGIGEKTVKVHRARVMSKMAVRSVAELVRLGIRTDVSTTLLDHAMRIGNSGVQNPCPQYIPPMVQKSHGERFRDVTTSATTLTSRPTETTLRMRSPKEMTQLSNIFAETLT